MMFKRSATTIAPFNTPADKVTSVLGPGISWQGALRGSGGVRIEGALEGDVAIRGMVVVGDTGKVQCQMMRANTVVVAGIVRGNITADKLDIRSTGRVWGDVAAVIFTIEEGAFLYGQIRMEEKIDLGLEDQDALPVQS